MARGTLCILIMAVGGHAAARAPSAKIKVSTSVVPEVQSEGDFSYAFATRDLQPVASGSLTVTAENNGVGPRFGYTPLRVHLANAGPSAVAAELSFDTLSSKVSRTVEVAPGERRAVVLPLPQGVTGGWLLVRSPGIVEGGRKALHFSPVYDDKRAIIALGEPKDFEDFIGKTPVHVDPLVTVLSIPVREAAEELAAYSGFDAVVLPAARIEELTEAQRRALEAYAATGGTLIVGSTSRATQTHLPLLAGDQVTRAIHPYGFGKVALCDRDQPRCRLEVKSAAAEPVVIPQGPPPAWARRARRYFDDDSMFGEMLLPQATAPLGLFLLIIFGFSLAIGPGSIWVARRRGTAALLLSIPATAAITCALIVGFSLAKDGFTVHAATRAVTLLHSPQRRAVTVGAGAYYANLAPAGARFTSNTALFAPSDESRGASVDWSQGLQLGADFLPSRVYREWGVVTVEPSRARLTVRREGNLPPRIQNALGGKLGTVVVRLGEHTWRVDGLDEGEEALARPAENAAHEWSEDFQTRLGSSALAAIGAPLEEGEFLAQMDGVGPFPLGGVKVDLYSAQHLIRGKVEQ